MESIYKKHDKVFDIRYGWGIITSIGKVDPSEITKVCENETDYVVNVDFPEMPAGCSYDVNGKDFSSDAASCLSFTEYKLEGFSQKRPNPIQDKITHVKSIYEINHSLQRKPGIMIINPLDFETLTKEPNWLKYGSFTSTYGCPHYDGMDVVRSEDIKVGEIRVTN